MKLTIVGCAGSYPGPDSSASCYLLEADHEGRTWRIVIDLGNGALGQLQRYCDPRDVDAIAISHLHPDHCIDMASFAVLAKYHPDGSYRKIPVYAPRGGEDYLGWAGGPGGEDPAESSEFHVWEDEPVMEVGPFRVTAALVDHPVTAFGMRIEVEGHVIGYSGDTGPTDVLLDIARDADLFLCEASFVESKENPPHLHLTGAEAGQVSATAAVKRLLITHVPAWTDAAEVEADVKSAWSGAYDMVRCGDVFTL
ncbi:metal-dependent hydrolase [Aeromicrobium sp. Root495]|uniref:MBL fold metallo-hydrolase n=1 Tax=Aeromicrobium sp. Root495 TaxID=1736550 RepID=UPI0006FF303E|nr:MBL fold metallo-hydrolase [Aeromicrobium sp. Root495]KQY58646.1 metal-dependent hydrolase [Aeromicrobium sp. Root495]